VIKGEMVKKMCDRGFRILEAILALYVSCML